MDSDETSIRIYGNTGILESRGTSAGTYNVKVLAYMNGQLVSL